MHSRDRYFNLRQNRNTTTRSNGIFTLHGIGTWISIWTKYMVPCRNVHTGLRQGPIAFFYKTPSHIPCPRALYTNVRDIFMALVFQKLFYFNVPKISINLKKNVKKALSYLTKVIFASSKHSTFALHFEQEHHNSSSFCTQLLFDIKTLSLFNKKNVKSKNK